jgi:hypothetical protein
LPALNLRISLYKGFDVDESLFARASLIDWNIVEVNIIYNKLI